MKSSIFIPIGFAPFCLRLILADTAFFLEQDEEKPAHDIAGNEVRKKGAKEAGVRD